MRGDKEEKIEDTGLDIREMSKVMSCERTEECQNGGVEEPE